MLLIISDSVLFMLCLFQYSKCISINIKHFYSTGQNPFLLIPAGATDEGTLTEHCSSLLTKPQSTVVECLPQRIDKKDHSHWFCSVPDLKTKTCPDSGQHLVMGRWERVMEILCLTGYFFPVRYICIKCNDMGE